MGMAQLSSKDQNALKNLCEVLGASFGGPVKIPETRVLEVLRENNMDSNRAFELLEEELQRSPWETKSKQEPKKKAAPKVKSRGDGPREAPRDNAERPRSARPANEGGKQGPRPGVKGKGKIPSPTNVAESNAAPTLVKAAPSAPQRSTAPAPAAAPAPVAASSAPAGNQWARGPPRAKQPEEPAPPPVVVPQPQLPVQEQSTPAKGQGKAWGNASKSKAIVSEAKPSVPVSAPVQAPEPDAGLTHHAPLRVDQAPTPQSQAVAAQPATQEQYHQHADPTSSIASLALGQEATVPASAPFAAGYNNGVQPDSSFAGNMYYSDQSNADKASARSGEQMPAQQMPPMQSMYGGLDVNGSMPQTSAAQQMPNIYGSGFDSSSTKLTSTVGLEQDSSASAGQNSQSLLLQQQQQYMMAMAQASGLGGYGGFPGAYGNMAAMYPYGGFGGYGGMGYGGMPNNMQTGGGSQGYNQSSGGKYNNRRNNNHSNSSYNQSNTGYGSGGYGNSFSSNYMAQSANDSSQLGGNSMNMYANMPNMYSNQMGTQGSMGSMGGMGGGMGGMGGGMGMDQSAGYGQQPQHQQQQQALGGMGMGSFSGGQINTSRYNMYSAPKGAEVNWAS